MDNRDPCYYDPNIYFRKRNDEDNFLGPKGACGKDGVCFTPDGPCETPKNYFSAKDKKVVSFKGYEPEVIWDVAQQGDIVFGVLKNDKTTIIAERYGRQVAIASKLSIERLIVFQNDIYIVSSGKLYARDPECYNRTCWYWYEASGMPSGIQWICTTLDGEYLWIQTTTDGYLYDCRRKLLETVTMPSTTIRVYGRKKNSYLEVNSLTDQMTFHKCNRSFAHVGIATFDLCNNVIYIRPEVKTIIRGIRPLDWGLYFLIA